MPLIKSAIKKMRQDTIRAKRNAKVRRVLRETIKQMRTSPTKKTLTRTFSKLDKAAKANIIHKNKASRLKSRLSKLLATK